MFQELVSQLHPFAQDCSASKQAPFLPDVQSGNQSNLRYNLYNQSDQNNRAYRPPAPEYTGWRYRSATQSRPYSRNDF